MMEADVIVLIRDGNIHENGSFSHLRAIKGEFARLANKASKSNHHDGDNLSSSDDSTVPNGSLPTIKTLARPADCTYEPIQMERNARNVQGQNGKYHMEAYRSKKAHCLFSS